MHKYSAQQSHEFALYVPDLSEHVKKSPDFLSLNDKELYHRITKILRINPGELLILFDRLVHLRCTLQEIRKNDLYFKLIIHESNRLFAPSMLFALPLLKKSDTEQAIYHCVATGVTEIQLLMTSKVQRRWGGQAEYERLMRVMIAAAEQSKQFAFPALKQPIAFDAFIQTTMKESKKIFFDPSGTSLAIILQTIKTSDFNHIVLLVGPEGDLNIEEKKQIQRAQFDFCALTPTILRAPDAVLLGAGVFRSFFY